jgi:hypothetical protein
VERVAFLVEPTGEQYRCLLNPESLVLRRTAGVAARHSPGGLVAGAELADDPLLLTGGGTTELELDLLFDVALAGSSAVSEDVRDLTGPLWDLAENTRASATYGRPPLVRFVWGKSWNVPGIVVAVAERLEQFTPGGVPTRSWLRMRLRRVAEPAGPAQAPERAALLAETAEGLSAETLLRAAEQAEVHELAGASGDGVCEERLDQLAYRYYGDATLWRLLAVFNGLDDPLHLDCGQSLQAPPLSLLEPGP